MSRFIFRYSEQMWPQVFLLVSLVLIIINLLIPLHLLRSPIEHFSQILLPLQTQVQYTLPKPLEWVHYVQHGTQQIEDLERQNAELRAQLGELTSLRQENAALQESMSIGESNESEITFRTTANLIKGGNQWAIDKGFLHGVRQGDVISSQGVMVGVVERALPNYSILTQLPQGDLQVVARTEQDTTGVVQYDQGQLWLKYVNIDQELAVGQSVYTAGSTEPSLPPGLYIGEITEVVKLDNASIMQARLDQRLQSVQLHTVLVSGYQERESVGQARDKAEQ